MTKKSINKHKQKLNAQKNLSADVRQIFRLHFHNLIQITFGGLSFKETAEEHLEEQLDFIAKTSYNLSFSVNNSAV